MDPATLVAHPLENTAQSADEAGVLVGDDQPDAVQAALLRVRRNPRQNTSSSESPTSSPRTPGRRRR